MVKMARSKRCSCGVFIRRFILSFIPGIILYEIFIDYSSLTPENNDKSSRLDGIFPVLSNTTAGAVQPEVPLLTPKPVKEHIEQHVIFGADDIHNIENAKIAMDDPLLLGYIRRRILGPSSKDLNLTDPLQTDHSQIEQSVFVDFALNYRKEGFFVECGAGDGEMFSNTLYLERERNWNGLLIEPHPEDFRSLLQKRRKSYAINACVSPYNNSKVEILRSASGFISGLKGFVDTLHFGTDYKSNWWYQGDINVQCFTLYSMLLALDVDHVDYLSIDVEGPEVEVLTTIPFHKIRIDVITVEYRAKGQSSDLVERSLQKLHSIREAVGRSGLYDEIGILPPLKIFNRNQAMQSQGALEKTGLDVVFRRTDLRDDRTS